MLTYSEVATIFYELIGERPDSVSLPVHMSVRQSLASLRSRAMMRLVNTITDAVANSEDLLAGTLQDSLFAHCDTTVQTGLAGQAIGPRKIFNHPNKVRMELMANQCLHLNDAFVPLAWTGTEAVEAAASMFEQQSR